VILKNRKNYIYSSVKLQNVQEVHIPPMRVFKHRKRVRK